MFVRLARFEGANPETRDARAAQLQSEIEAVKAGGSPEGAPPEAAEVLRSSVSRVLALVDTQTGIEANAVFCESEEDLRRADQVLSTMSPSEGDGHRTDLAQYEVVVDVEF